MPQGTQLQKCCRLTTHKLSVPAKRSIERLGKLVSRVRYERYVAALDQPPETMNQRDTVDPPGEK